jgi:hypothetical protein
MTFQSPRRPRKTFRAIRGIARTSLYAPCEVHERVVRDIEEDAD